jgi:hypothetical protein
MENNMIKPMRLRVLAAALSMAACVPVLAADDAVQL